MHTFVQIPTPALAEPPLASRGGQRPPADFADHATAPCYARDFCRVPAHAPAPGIVQAKLRIGTPGDAAEQEADRVSEQVRRTPQPQPIIARVWLAAPLRLQANQDGGSAGMMAPPAALDVLRSPGQALDPGLRAFMEPRFGHDFGQVRVHTDAASAQSAAALDARAYTAGSDVVFGHGEFRPQSHAGRALVAHELAHVCQASGAPPTLRRAVRIDGGKTRVRESDYQPGGNYADMGDRFKVAALISDSVQRAFINEFELQNYAYGATDYIGDVKTKAGITYWFRLPKDKLTVLGEKHASELGNVDDVIAGLGTNRFKNEAFSEVVDVAGQHTPGAQAKERQIVQQRPKAAPSGTIGEYTPELENATIKAFAGASYLRHINPGDIQEADRKAWGSRATTSDHNWGSAVAELIALSIHIAADLATQGFGAPAAGEPAITARARRLADYYTANKAALDALMTTTDADPLLGILPMVEPNSFAVLPMLRGLADVMLEYGTAYVAQLSKERGNKELAAAGKHLEANRSKESIPIDSVREAIMWEKIEEAIAAGYLLVGMGDIHRGRLADKLDKRGIPHAFVEDELVKQKQDVIAKWKK
jgi:hypothetical protein